MAKYKVDIFKLLKTISDGSHKTIDSYTDEDLKSISPVVLQMWIMGANNNVDARLTMTDEFVNQYAFTLQKHKKLLLKLLCVANDCKQDTKFQFKKQKAVKHSYLIDMVQDYYNISKEHASQDYRILTKENFESIGVEMGFDKPEQKKLDNAIDKRFR